MQINWSKLLKYVVYGTIAIPLAIVSHEFGHYFAYVLFGASNVRLHSVSVSADDTSLSNVQAAITSSIGPAISYLTALFAFIVTRKRYQPFWIILALATPIGRVVNFIYIYFRLAGYKPNPNFDEFNFSKRLGIEPLWIAVPTAVVVLIIFGHFVKKVWDEGGFAELGQVALSLAAGLVVWSVVGGLILP